MIGVVLALGVCTYVAVMGMDRDRALYPAVLVVIASYYVLFAVVGGGGRVIGIEALLAVVFVVAASVGFRKSPWITASAIAGHGVLDAVHGGLVDNPGVPVWWPAFCLAFDVTAGAYLAWALTRQTAGGSVGRRGQPNLGEAAVTGCAGANCQCAPRGSADSRPQASSVLGDGRPSVEFIPASARRISRYVAEPMLGN